MTMIETKGPRPYHAGRLARGEAAKTVKTPAAWKEPKYPGDSILQVDLVRGDEWGDIRVQWYGNGMKPTPDDKLKVGAFLPGYETSSPGDTPKWWPDKDEWVDSRLAASSVFMKYMIAAIRDGWRPRCT